MAIYVTLIYIVYKHSNEPPVTLDKICQSSVDSWQHGHSSQSDDIADGNNIRVNLLLVIETIVYEAKEGILTCSDLFYRDFPRCFNMNKTTATPLHQARPRPLTFTSEEHNLL